MTPTHAASVHGRACLAADRRRFVDIANIHATAIRLCEAKILGHRRKMDAAEREVARIDAAVVALDAVDAACSRVRRQR